MNKSINKHNENIIKICYSVNLKKCDGAIKENGIHVTGENNQESFVALERSIEPICDSP